VPAADHGPDRNAGDRAADDRTGDDRDGSPVTFRITRRRMFVTMVGVAALSWVVINTFAGIIELLAGRGAAVPELMPLLVSAAVYAVVFGGIFLLVVRRHPAWVTVSDRGLELAGTGRDPVSLPWSAVEAVSLRWWGPFTELVVTPTDMEAATVSRHGWSKPRTVVREGDRSFLVDSGLMQPGPAALLAEIHRRRP
jgi:hypothetical protein